MRDFSARWFGAGQSNAADSAKAGAEAARTALDGRDASAVFVFASVAHELPTLLAAVRAEAGPDPVIVGSTTVGTLSSSGLTARGVAIGAVGGAGFTVRTKVSLIGRTGHRTAGAEVASVVRDLDRPHSVLMLLCDGLSGNPHEVVRGAYSVAGAHIPLVGGFSGDDRQFTRTYQFHSAAGEDQVEVMSGAVVGVGFGSDRPLGIGIAHGFRRREPAMVVTRSSGQKILEIDGRPALDVLAERLGVPATSDDLFATDIHAIGLSRRSGEDVRILQGGDDEERSVLSTVEMPQGALFWIMESDRESLIAGAAESCAEAVAGLNGEPPLGLLAFDCGGRSATLGEDGMNDELTAIRSALGDAPFAGFYTLGEIARTRGSLGMHSLTLVTLAMA